MVANLLFFFSLNSKVTMYLQRCLQFNGLSASWLYHREPKTDTELKLIELAIQIFLLFFKKRNFQVFHTVET